LCELKSCTDRTANSSTTNPCGPDLCYKDLGDENKCASMCYNLNHYFINSSTSSCELKNCTDRTTNHSSINPCGVGKCYFDPQGGNKCIYETCTSPNLYEAVNGTCIFSNCLSRIPNEDSSNFPCGGDLSCTLDIDNLTCKMSCSEPEHYKANNYGRCELKSCDERISNGNRENPCGIGCFNYIVNNSCLTGCPSDFYDIGGNGICSSVSCNSIIPFEETCKFNCLFDYNDNSCRSDCSDPNFYEIYNNESCRLKSCYLRSWNGEDINGCGSGCVLNKTENICQNECLGNYTNENGVCIEKKDDSGDYNDDDDDDGDDDDNNNNDDDDNDYDSSSININNNDNDNKDKNINDLLIIIGVIIGVIGIISLIVNIIIILYRKNRKNKIPASENNEDNLKRDVEMNENENNKSKFIFLFFFSILYLKNLY
jgi:hypothetical protein